MKSIFIALIAAAAITAAAAPAEKKPVEKNAEKCVLCETRKEFALERYTLCVKVIKRYFGVNNQKRFEKLAKAEKDYIECVKQAAADHAAGKHK
jgi:hypothetical protein